MKILLTTSFHLPHHGAIQNYINLLRKELIKEGNQVDIIAYDNEKKEKLYRLTTGEYIDQTQIEDIVFKKVFDYYEANHPYLEPWVRWREIERYKYELCMTMFDLNRYDIIHTQDVLSTRAVARIKPPHVSLISTIHHLHSADHIISGDVKSKRTFPWTYVCAEEYYSVISSDQTITPTHWLKKSLTRNSFRIPDNKLTTIPYGIDVKHFLKNLHSPTMEPTPFGENGKTIILCPANLVLDMGYVYFFESIAILKQKRTNFEVWIVGNEESQKELLTLSHKLNIQNVIRFLGKRTDEPQLMARCHFVVLPTAGDRSLFTIMEAQIAGKLIIAPDIQGMSEMITDRETGLLYPYQNRDALARKIDEILYNPENRNNIAQRGMVWRREHSSSVSFVNNTKNVYQVAINEKTGGRAYVYQ